MINNTATNFIRFSPYNLCIMTNCRTSPAITPSRRSTFKVVYFIIPSLGSIIRTKSMTTSPEKIFTESFHMRVYHFTYVFKIPLHLFFDVHIICNSLHICCSWLSRFISKSDFLSQLIVEFDKIISLGLCWSRICLSSALSISLVDC